MSRREIAQGSGMVGKEQAEENRENGALGAPLYVIMLV